MGLDFTKLDIWNEAKRLVVQIYKLAEEFPDFERYGLISQITRSANSVMANIAEAHGRYYYLDKIKTLYISRAEIYETRSHLLLAKDVKYIDEETFHLLNVSYISLAIKINNLIAKIRESKKESLSTPRQKQSQ